MLIMRAKVIAIATPAHIAGLFPTLNSAKDYVQYRNDRAGRRVWKAVMLDAPITP